MNTSKGYERVNDQGAVERKVESVDYRWQAGQDQPKKENVEVVHEIHDGGDSAAGGGVVAGAAAKVTDAFQSAKDAISSTGAKNESTVATATKKDT